MREPSPLILPGDRLFYANFLDLQRAVGQPRSTYDGDPASPSPLLDLAMLRRQMHANDWNMGGGIVGNEAGTGLVAHVSWRDILALRGGNIWMHEQALPFGGLLVSPELNLWRFKLAYLGTLTGVGNLPTEGTGSLFSAHTGALSFSYPIPLNSLDPAKILDVTAAAVGGGNFSWPTFMDIYFNFLAGVSMRLRGYPDSGFSYSIYAFPVFYAGTDNPQETAYIGRYTLKFQRAEVGFQARIFQDYLIGAFADIGGLNNQYGLRGIWEWVISDQVSGRLWIAGGITQWIEPFAGRIGPYITLGASVTYGGEHMDSTNTSSYDHQQDASRRPSALDSAYGHAGIHGFGSSGDATWDVIVNRAKSRISNSSSFRDFADSYSGTSPQELINTARFLGAFLGDEAYANGVQDALMNSRIFDSELQRVAGAGLDDIFLWMQQFIDWRSTHGDEPLPDDLRGGIAVCAGIHWFIAEFFRSNGMDALVAGGINTPNGPHVVTLLRYGSEVMLFDYGDTYTGRDIDEVIRDYGEHKGVPNFVIYLFGPNGLEGIYITSEGRLINMTMGLDNEAIMRRLLGIE